MHNTFIFNSCKTAIAKSASYIASVLGILAATAAASYD
jgi:hypothetical protein